MLRYIFLLFFLPSFALGADSIPCDVDSTVDFKLRDASDLSTFVDSISFTTGDCATSDCCKMIIDQASPVDCDNQPIFVGNGYYKLTISSTAAAGKTVAFSLQDAATSIRFPDTGLEYHTLCSDGSGFHNTTLGAVDSGVIAALQNGLATSTLVNNLLIGAVNELTSVPGNNPTLTEMVQVMYLLTKHRRVTTPTLDKVYRQNGSTLLGEFSVNFDEPTETLDRGSLVNP